KFSPARVVHSCGARCVCRVAFDTGTEVSQNSTVETLVRISRGIGFAVLGAAVAAPLLWLAGGLSRGPPSRAALEIGGRLASIYWRSVCIAIGAALLALLLAIPGLFALIHVRDGSRRRLLSGLSLVPLVAPPCVFGYAWMLLASQ